MRSLYRCTAAAAAGSAVLALGLSIARAQTQDVPKLWAEFYPRGAMGYDSRGYQPIDQNPILHRMVMLNAAYPSINWHTLPPPGTLFPGLWSPSINDAVDSDNQPAPGIPNVNLVARRLALESLRRGFIRANYSDSNNTARDLALNLIRTGMPRSEVRTVVSGGPQTVLTSAVVISLPDKPDIGGPEEDPDRNNYIEFPDLYAAQTPTGDDTIVFNRGRFPACAAGNTRMRTVWMQAGIIDTRAWVQRVVTQYNAYSNPENSDLAPIGQAAYPSRVVFDQEPALILMSQPLANECEGPEYALMDLEKLVTWRDCVEYWAALQADLRWQWMPVPGCNGQTMAQLWAGRDLAQFETPGNPNDDEPDLAQGDSVRDGLTQVNPLHFRWIGGSARNQAWYRWFCMINQQAYIGALDEAAFSVIRQHWPNAWCSDYDACRTSGFGLRAYTGVQGPQGLNFPVEPWYGWWDNQPNSGFVNPIPMTQDPAAANVQNAPHIYSDVSAWQWDKFSVQHSQHPDALRWGNTGDAVAPTFGPRTANGRAAPWSDRNPNIAEPGDDAAVQLNTPPLSIGIGYDDEFWEESSIRFNRWTLEGVVSKNLDHLGGTDPACAAWIALPHQPLKNFGPWRGRAPVDGVNTDHYKYNGLLYTYGPQSPWFERGYVPTRQSVYATYRTLADARARGISEFFVWSNTGPDADAGFDETPAFHANGRWGNREGFDLHRGVHPDWPANWDLLHNAVNHVFNYDCASVVPQHGGTLVSPSTSAGALAALKYADEGATGFTAERSVRVHSALLTSTKRTGAVLVFGPRTDTGLPALGTSINLSVRAMPHFSRIAEEPPPNPAMQIGLEVFIHSGASGFWKNIDEPTSSTQDPSKTVELDGLMLLGGAVQAVEGRCINVRARIPFSRQPDQDEGSIGVVGTDGSIKMRVTLRFASGAAPAVEPVLIIDHATVYLSDEAYRDPTGAQSHSFLIPGDLNTDGTVDEKDNLLFEHLVSPGGNDTGMPGVPVAANAAKPAHRMFADFNRDGLITDTGSPGGLGDKYFWNRAGYLETLYVHGLDIVNPSNPVIMGLMNAKRIDAYRQSATEIPHPCPACRADIGVQGGTPGGDCVLDNNDFVVFIDYFFQQNAVADVGSQGGVTGPDGAWDNNDFVVFIDYFFNSVCD